MYYSISTKTITLISLCKFTLAISRSQYVIKTTFLQNLCIFLEIHFTCTKGCLYLPITKDTIISCVIPNHSNSLLLPHSKSPPPLPPTHIHALGWKLYSHHPMQHFTVFHCNITICGNCENIVNFPNIEYIVLSTPTHVCVNTCTMHMHMQCTVHIYLNIAHTYICTHTLHVPYRHIHTVHTYIHTYMHTYIHVHTHTYTCTYIHVIHTYNYIHTITYCMHACTFSCMHPLCFANQWIPSGYPELE